MMYHVYPPEIVDDRFDEIPEPGEKIWFGDEEHIILKVSIINESKLLFKTMEKREVEVFDKPVDESVGWGESEVINRFLDDQESVLRVEE